MADRTSFYYDPARQGYSTTIWKTLTGTPTTGLFLFIDINADVDIDVVFDTITVSEGITILIPRLSPSVSDSITITESRTINVV